MDRPGEICQDCFDRNRVTHNVGESDLIGVYCTHTGTGGIIERQGELLSEWRFQRVPESAFWFPLRLTARLVRGEITDAQFFREMFGHAIKEGKKRRAER